MIEEERVRKKERKHEQKKKDIIWYLSVQWLERISQDQPKYTLIQVIQLCLNTYSKHHICGAS